jgi:hypothetical protein
MTTGFKPAFLSTPEMKSRGLFTNFCLKKTGMKPRKISRKLYPKGNYKAQSVPNLIVASIAGPLLHNFVCGRMTNVCPILLGNTRNTGTTRISLAGILLIFALLTKRIKLTQNLRLIIPKISAMI